MGHQRDEKDVQRFVDSAKQLLASSRTLRDIYELSTSLHANEKACIFFDEDGRKQSYTYAQYKTHAYYLARHLSSALSDIPSGALIALKLKNCPSWPLLFWAGLMGGHPMLLIDAKLAHENTENLLKQSGAKAILVNEEDPYSVPSFRLNEIKNSDDDASFAPHWANQVIFCSSGTTGDAKMMVTDGEALSFQIAGALDMPKETLDILHSGKSNILSMIPLHHIFGFTAVFLWYTFYGKAIVYPTSMSTNDLFMAIKKAPVTHLYSVPMFWDAVAQKVQRSAALKGGKAVTLLDNLIAYNNHQISRQEASWASWGFVKRSFQKKIFGTQIEYCISGGGYLSQKTLNVINGLGYPLYNGYGMTEIGVTSVELSSRVEDRLKGSIGHLFRGMEYKIVPSAGAKEGQGELYVKSPTIHKEEIIGGIRKTTVLTPDGFYPTGDIAEKDATGKYYIKGRSKDTIISSNGENVYPDEIEFYFKDVPHVANDVVVGVKNGEKEDVVLILELDNIVETGDFPAIKKAIAAINEQLPNEKRVSRTLIYKKSMPIANNMKVKRYVLRDAIKAGGDDFMSFDDERKGVSLEGYDPAEVSEVLEKVRHVFSKSLLLPEFKIGDDAIWTTDLGGDSMSYVAMATDLNEAFHLSIPTEKYGKLACVKDFTAEILALRHSAPKTPSEQK
ncbi:MAG: AMP-binding protein [Bacilli bacterium]